MKNEELLVRKSLETGQDPTSEKELRVARELYTHEDNRFLQEELDIRRLPFVLDKLGWPVYTAESVERYEEEVKEQDWAAVLAPFSPLARKLIRFGKESFAGVGNTVFYCLMPLILLCVLMSRSEWAGKIYVASAAAVLCGIAITIYHAAITPRLKGWHYCSPKYYKGEMLPTTMHRMLELKEEMPTAEVSIVVYGYWEEDRLDPALDIKSFLFVRCGDEEKTQKYYVPIE